MTDDVRDTNDEIPLVLVHGFLSSSEYWGSVDEQLASGRRLIAIDLPGFGKRSHEPSIHSITGFAHWVISELDSMGVERFRLLGHSMGGMIVQEMAHLVPDRIAALVLYGTGPEGELPGRFEPIHESRRKVSDNGTDGTVSFIVSNWYVQGSKDVWYETSLAIARKARTETVLGGLAAMEGWRGVGYLETHEMPTLVIWGDKDRAYPISQELALFQGIPEAQLAVIPGAGHNAHHEKPGLFCALLEDFMANCPRC
ncbi:alpha/beta fold hydrolase [Cobetia amphilecti]|uniref:alpha/beta fold hydrolase n=1 Tax=Cobetia amphilecti TaxID=1055104 RepID=UPI0032993044